MSADDSAHATPQATEPSASQSSTELRLPDRAGPTRPASLPTLYRDHSFWGMTVTQFLGAFNDNLFKQLMLLLSLKVAAQDRQPIAMAVFATPFLLFSGLAGFLSERHSKRTIIVLSKAAEIVVMFLGMIAFLSFEVWGFAGLLLVLLWMGTQSAFFGPSKYGILPEMLREPDLPRANGVILMTTFLAIIFGTAAAGFFSDFAIQDGQPLDGVAHRFWVASAVCIAIAVVGTMTSLLVRRVPAALPRLRFAPSALVVPPETRRMLRDDHPLRAALLASCVFWLVAGVSQQAVNSLGSTQLELGDRWTSTLAASIGAGIAIGAVLAGRLSHGTADFRVMRVGSWGIVACLLVLSLPGPIHGHLLGFWGSLPMLVLTGAFAGMFAIPLQVFMQSRPPEGQKGRMIAVMNQANWVAILFSAAIYWAFDRIVVLLDVNRSPIFALTALLMLPTALLYRGGSRE